MPAHSALLSGVLRLQVRHRHVGGHRPGRAAGKGIEPHAAGPVVVDPSKARDDYLRFLGGGCSKDPLDLLRDAGVDMEQPAPVDAALDEFAALVEELDQLL